MSRQLPAMVFFLAQLLLSSCRQEHPLFGSQDMVAPEAIFPARAFEHDSIALFSGMRQDTTRPIWSGRPEDMHAMPAMIQIGKEPISWRLLGFNAGGEICFNALWFNETLDVFTDSCPLTGARPVVADTGGDMSRDTLGVFHVSLSPASAGEGAIWSIVDADGNQVLPDLGSAAMEIRVDSRQPGRFRFNVFARGRYHISLKSVGHLSREWTWVFDRTETAHEEWALSDSLALQPSPHPWILRQDSADSRMESLQVSLLPRGEFAKWNLGWEGRHLTPGTVVGDILHVATRDLQASQLVRLSTGEGRLLRVDRVPLRNTGADLFPGTPTELAPDTDRVWVTYPLERKLGVQALTHEGAATDTLIQLEFEPHHLLLQGGHCWVAGLDSEDKIRLLRYERAPPHALDIAMDTPLHSDGLNPLARGPRLFHAGEGLVLMEGGGPGRLGRMGYLPWEGRGEWLLQTLSFTQPLAFALSGQRIWVAGLDPQATSWRPTGSVEAWQRETGLHFSSLQAAGPITGLQVAQDGNLQGYVFFTDGDGAVHCHHAESGNWIDTWIVPGVHSIQRLHLLERQSLLIFVADTEIYGWKSG